MSEFVAIRNRRLEGFAAETNKLTIRLDKLLMNLPTDPARKKSMALFSIDFMMKLTVVIV